MIRFIHTADIHFGVENYGRIDAKTGIHTRLLDFYQALTFCIDRAIDEDVDFFLFSGDAYKTAHPSPTQQRMLCECFLRLFKANIPIIIVVGNHDNPLSFGKAHALELFGQLPLDGFHVFSKPGVLTLKTKSGPVQIVGVPWPSRSTIALGSHTQSSATDISGYISRAVSDMISTFASKLDPNTPAILTGHLTVSTGVFSGSEKRAIMGNDPIFLPSQLAIPPFDYVGLGHLHRYQNLNTQGHPPIVYPGSIERIDFGERKEEKGFCLVTIHNKQRTEHTFIKTPIRRFIQLDVYLEGSESQTDHILHELKKHELENAILKIVYHVPQGKKDRVDFLAVQQACAQAHYLSGIIPVRALETRDRRPQLKVTMGFNQLLDNYFSQKPEWKDKRSVLLQKALELEAELDSETS